MNSPTTKAEAIGAINYEIVRWDGAQDEFDLNGFRFWHAIGVQKVLAQVLVQLEDWTMREWHDYQVEFSITLWEQAFSFYKESGQVSYGNGIEGQLKAQAKAEARASVARWFAGLVFGNRIIIPSPRH